MCVWLWWVGYSFRQWDKLLFAFQPIKQPAWFFPLQSVKEAPTILLIKAASKDFPETNLSVITDDGSVYSFLVSYEKNPTEWVYHLTINKNTALATYANAILDNPQTIRGIKDKK